MYAYLKKRGVSPQIIRSFISAGLLYEDSEHHNCVFVGYDRDGKAAFASLRGTYDRDGSGFKGDAAGSDKSIGFRLPYAPDSRSVYEKAVLLTPTEENVRIWVKCTRMTKEEMEDTIKESRELAGVFTSIAGLMEHLLPERGTL